MGASWVSVKNAFQISQGAQLLRTGALGFPELLYLSEMSGSPRRGGVPVLFPQFATDGPLKKHGFARDMKWKCISEVNSSNAIQTCYELNIDSDNPYGWGHNAKLSLTTVVGNGAFTQELIVRNTGNEKFSWTGGLHPYFLVEDFKSVRMSGLENVPFHDRLGSVDAEGSLIKFFDGCELLYSSAPEVQFFNGKHALKIQTAGFDQWMIWNPGKVASERMMDVQEQDWQRFLCIEPICLENPIKLEPGKAFVGRLCVTVR